MKELLEKYWNELEHYKNGGKLAGRRWVIDPNDGDSSFTIWYEIDSCSTWMMKDLLTNPQDRLELIINDEYFIYRKALAEGKTVQLNEAEKFADSNRGWVDLSCKSFGKSTNLFPVNYYRIKPDESKFKVGDFVTPLNREINCSVWQIDNILSCNTLVSGNTMLDPRTIKPWTPVKGEWCWFCDSKSSKSAALAKFNKINNNYFISTTGTHWNLCEPFLNSRPSYLKDK